MFQFVKVVAVNDIFRLIIHNFLIKYTVLFCVVRKKC